MRCLLPFLVTILVAPVLASPGLERAPVNGDYLTYQQRGDGEAILTIHGALVADSFVPIMEAPALERFQLIRYRRSGYADSASLDIPPEAFLDRAVADAVALLDHLEVERAHVVGHSSGAVIAMELALRWPDRVHSLMLLEPPMSMVPAAEELFAIIGKAAAHHGQGDSAAGVDVFLTHLTRPEWQQLMDDRVPGAVDQAVADADTFFDLEVPGLGEFEFDAERAARLSMPILYVLGSESSAIAGAEGFFEQGKELLLNKLPNAESITLDGVDHSLQIGFPEKLAPVIAEFAARHPIE
jgi:pimeloyl-ACP methyl ester carboxylesterase